jgi:hypothetical protein
VEFNNCTPILLIDYKHEKASISNTASIRTQRSLANLARLPFFIVRYADDFSWFEIIAENEFAVDKLRCISNRPECILLSHAFKVSEEHFVKTLYKLRGKHCPDSVLEGIKNNQTKGHINE